MAGKDEPVPKCPDYSKEQRGSMYILVLLRWRASARMWLTVPFRLATRRLVRDGGAAAPFPA